MKRRLARALLSVIMRPNYCGVHSAMRSVISNTGHCSTRASSNLFPFAYFHRVNHDGRRFHHVILLDCTGFDGPPALDSATAVDHLRAAGRRDCVCLLRVLPWRRSVPVEEIRWILRFLRNVVDLTSIMIYCHWGKKYLSKYNIIALFEILI